MCARRRVADRLAGVAEHVGEHVAIARPTARRSVSASCARGTRCRLRGSRRMSARRRCTRCWARRSRWCRLASPVELVGQVEELVVEQAEQAAERALLAGVRRGRHQHQVPVRRPATVPGPAGGAGGGRCGAFAGVGAGVGLVDDHEVGAGPDEVVAATVALDEVDRHDRVRVHVEQRLAVQAGRARGGRRSTTAPVRRRCGTSRPAPAATARRGAAGTARTCAATSPCSSSSLAISAASIVLPMPTSSAISSRTGSSLSAISSGTS